MTVPALQGFEFALFDIDHERIRDSEIMLKKLNWNVDIPKSMVYARRSLIRLELGANKPDGSTFGAMQRYSGIRTVGLCHSVQVCANHLLIGLDMPTDDVQWEFARSQQLGSKNTFGVYTIC